MSAIEAGEQLGLQTIPRTELEEVRGEGFGNDVVGTIIAIAMSSNISKTQLLRSLYAVQQTYGWAWYLSTAGAKAFGWEIGRALALRDGNPDLGPFYSKSNIIRLAPWYVRAGNSIVKQNR
jgi:hypothetical protein